MSDEELDAKKVPTSRVARAAVVGRLAASTSVKTMGTRAANTVRSDEAARRAAERRQVETAEQIVTALGTMKGAAMKLGQVLSFLDVGLVPEDHREEFQKKLAALRDAAPKVSFKDMRKVIEQDLGEKLREEFAEFDERPIAAASIGQVYRARLHDGRDVAVKVQYPGVNAAVRADMQNLGLIMRLIKGLVPGLDTKALAQEIRERVIEELDYELEASNQRRLARIFRGHPFIVIPEVVTELCRERVIVSEFVPGRGFDELRDTASDAERDRIGEIIFRFYFECMYVHRQFSGDPHPGNFLVMDDDRVCFLDFGLFKVISKEAAEIELESLRYVMDDDAPALKDLFARRGFLNDAERMDPRRLMDYVQLASWWYTQPGPVTLTPEIATQVMIEMGDPRGQHFARMRHESLPPEHLFGRRLEQLTLAVLGQLRATGDWNAMAREWVYGEPPQTELGRLQAEHVAGA